MRLECAPLKSTTVEGEDGVTYYLYETSRIGAPRQQQPKGGDEVREHDPPANVNFDACQCSMPAVHALLRARCRARHRTRPGGTRIRPC